jgi:hypothetical protein
MDNLEKYILENRQAFDGEMPENKQWESIRIEILKRKRTSLTPWLRAVAAIFILGLAFFIQKQNNPIKKIIHNNENRDILLQVNKHYHNESSILLEQVKHVTARDTLLQTEILKDYTQIDILIESTMKDLNDGADNQEVIKTLIEYYELKLFILKDILMQLDTTQNDLNQNNYENKIIL